MNFLRRRLFFVLANILIPVAVLVFGAGLFRQESPPPETEHELLHAINNGDQGFTEKEAPFDKIVFMVIDALRSDFVYSAPSGFQFTQSLIRSGAAVPFTAHASPPSLTISRIKAMTTGSSPSFLDVILNIADSDTASNLSHEDTWLSRLKATDRGKMVFYGENTWLQLFPDIFDRREGASAFYVPDFTEIDRNVTLHVLSELRNRDWGALVCHFPGLDHVGHTGGPSSPYMMSKQQEMDGVIQNVYESIETEAHANSTLFVVTGDHGMNRQGNHGGSSVGETSAGLLFLSPRFKRVTKGQQSPATSGDSEFGFHTVVDQADIVPTLAGLLGFPIPRNSLGVFIPELLTLWDDYRDRLRLMWENGFQLMKAHGSQAWNTLADWDSPENITDSSGCLWDRVRNQLTGEDVDLPAAENNLADMHQSWKRAQQLMSMTASSPDFRLISSGLLCAITAVVLCYMQQPTNSMRNKDGIIFGMVIAFYNLAMFFTRYVQEEHHFWYPVSLIWLAYLGYQSGISQLSRRDGLFYLAVVAIQIASQCWTPSGDSKDKAPQLIQSHIFRHPLILWALSTMAYVGSSIRLSTYIVKTRGSRAFSTVSCAGIIAALIAGLSLIFKLGCAVRDSPDLASFVPGWILEEVRAIHLAHTARMIFSMLFGILIYVLLMRGGVADRSQKQESLASIHEILTIYLMTQSRPTNIPLFLFFQLQLHLLFTMLPHLSTLQISLSTVLLSQASYFTFGNSNSISSVDLTNGFNGITLYSPVAVPLLTFFTNWAGPTWWAFAGMRLLFNHQNSVQHNPNLSNGSAINGTPKALRPPITPRNRKAAKPSRAAGPSSFQAHLALQTLFAAFSLTAVMVACVALRNTPALWLALAPKYIFAGMWGVFFHLMVNVGLCGLVWTVVGCG